MLGAIAGDIIGSRFEARERSIKTINFSLYQKDNPAASRFTDDTVMTVAVAHALLTGTGFAEAYRDFGRRYPNVGYGRSFKQWINTPDAGPYGSYGNGAAMRVSPIGWAFNDPDSVLDWAQRSAEVSHNHPEGIKGAQAIALAVFLARCGKGKDNIREEIQQRFGYNLQRTVADIRPDYKFDVSCQGSVPEALIAFFDSTDYESAVRLAVSLGGDSDTQACMAGAVAHAHYGGVPSHIVLATRARLPSNLLAVVDSFGAAHGP